MFTKNRIFFLLNVIFFCLIEIFIHQYNFQTEINQEIMKGETIVIESAEKIELWQIEIPKISLMNKISEGITQEIIKQSVGHFSNTSRRQGNVGLALCSKDLKLLRQGDEITYKYNEFEMIYEIEKCRIIRDTECEYLEETENNMLTIITYVENQPEYRRCIQAVEKEETIY